MRARKPYAPTTSWCVTARALDTRLATYDPDPVVFDWFDGAVQTATFCGLIAVVFMVAWRHLERERSFLAALNNYVMMKYRLGVQPTLSAVQTDVVDAITRIEDTTDPVRRQMAIDGLRKRAVRLEGSVGFWVDLLQKLGLLGTVLGLGIALAQQDSAVNDLLKPLSLAVWSTVTGLVASIVISWRFGRDVDVEVDAHEEHLHEWQSRLANRGEQVVVSAARADADHGSAEERE